MKRLTGWRLFLAAMLLPLAAAGAGKFVAPGDVPPPFRREALPVDVDTMTSLGRQLAVLGGEAARSDDAATRRAGAQLYALALGLDPTNRDARQAARGCEQGSLPEAVPAAQQANAKAKAWTVWSWLASDEAGAEAQRFAACLGDALTAVDPDHPKAAALRQHGEKGRWDGWVAKLQDFGAKGSAPEGSGNEADGTKEIAGTDSETGQKDSTSGNRSATVLLKKAEVAMPLTYYDSRNEKTVSGLTSVHVSAWTEEAGSDSGDDDSGNDHSGSSYSFGIAGVDEMHRMGKAYDNVISALRELHGGLPPRGRAGIGFAKEIKYSISGNDDSISGPALVLLDATLRGKAPAADAIIFGRISSQPAFALPRRAWDRLRLLEQGSAGRLIVPKEAADLLPGFLVLEKPEFFLQHEVIAASSIEELIERSGNPEQGPLTDALSKFGEIRKVAEGKPAAQFAAHPSTRQRLTEVVQLYPDHLSARMLLIQGSGSRPSKFPTAILAREIRRCIKPIAGLSSSWDHMPGAPQLEAAHEACRKALDVLAPRVDIRDRSLHEQALELANSLRTVSRKARSAGGEDWKIRETIGPQLRRIQADYGQLMEKLDELSGEDEYQAPKPRPPQQ